MEIAWEEVLVPFEDEGRSVEIAVRSWLSDEGKPSQRKVQLRQRWWNRREETWSYKSLSTIPLEVWETLLVHEHRIAELLGHKEELPDMQKRIFPEDTPDCVPVDTPF